MGSSRLVRSVVVAIGSRAQFESPICKNSYSRRRYSAGGHHADNTRHHWRRECCWVRCIRALPRWHRADTVVGCYLVEQGLKPEEALAKIPDLRHGLPFRSSGTPAFYTTEAAPVVKFAEIFCCAPFPKPKIQCALFTA